MQEGDLKKTILTVFSGPEGTYQSLAIAALGLVCCQVVVFCIFYHKSDKFLFNIFLFLQFKYTTNLVYIFDIVKLSVCIQSLYS